MRNGNVLVVEDDDTIRRLLVDFLALNAYVLVDSARDGVDALHLISTHHYAVVLLDMMMPKMSGIDLLHSLHAKLSDPSLDPLDSRPAVIVVTATAASALPAESLEQRFPQLVRAVFRKPADLNELAMRVSQLLGETVPPSPQGARPTA
jgi:CheY-like chemotaxis protein